MTRWMLPVPECIPPLSHAFARVFPIPKALHGGHSEAAKSQVAHVEFRWSSNIRERGKLAFFFLPLSASFSAHITARCSPLDTGECMGFVCMEAFLALLKSCFRVHRVCGSHKKKSPSNVLNSFPISIFCSFVPSSPRFVPLDVAHHLSNEQTYGLFLFIAAAICSLDVADARDC